jgi:signal transduction histidine kinase
MQLLPQESRILVVDDNPKNIQLAGSFLSREGYAVEFASSGREALDWLVTEPFDLVLLDVIMPGMDGFETCKSIKKIKSCIEMPVIFLTAKNDQDTFAQGFEAGGVDYIFKPFVMEELIVRVRTHLQIYNQQRQLRRLNATRDRLLSIISHDLHTQVYSNVLLLERLTNQTAKFSSQELHELLSETLESAQLSKTMLETMLVWARAQKGQIVFEPVLLDPVLLLKELCDAFRHMAASKEVRLDMDQMSEGRLRTDSFMLGTVLRNLISNAVRYTKAGGIVAVSAIFEKGLWTFSIADTGIGMSKDQLDQIFEIDKKDLLTTGTAGGSGLGLLICKDFVEKMGGDIRFISTPGEGTKAELRIPPGIKA